MRVRTDDEVYRVDAVWLGPPKATFPWRARYVAWGIGIVVFLLVFTVQRAIGFSFGFFTVAWGLIITVVITRFIGSKINHERPMTAVFAMWARELGAPRERSAGQGGAASATKIRVHAHRPRPRSKSRPTPPPPPRTTTAKPAKPPKTRNQPKPAKGKGKKVAGGKHLGPAGGRTDPRALGRGNTAGRPQQMRQPMPRAHNVPYVQNTQPGQQPWPGRQGEQPPAGIPVQQPGQQQLGQGQGQNRRTARRRSKEVGGVRTPGRR